MVGGGLFASIGEVHRKALIFDARAEIVAGCFSTDPARNKTTGQAYGLDSRRIYSNYNEMAKAESAGEDGIDFVVVVTPNNTHYEISKAFLKAGIHVVCDKPLCFEVWQAEELAKLAEQKGLLFGVTYTYIGYTMVKVMREMIQSGAIGDIVALNAEYLNDLMLDKLDFDANHPSVQPVWRMNPKYTGIANCVGDIGTHIECIVHYVTGLKIKRLLATINTYGHVLDLNANIILEYENGVNGAYWCSNVAAGKLNGLQMRIYGSKGSLEWEQESPDYVRYTPKGEPPQILSRGSGYIKEAAGGYSRMPAGHPEGMYMAFANLYKNIVGAVIKLKSGEKPSGQELDFPTARDGLSGVKFIHAVVESAKNGSAWVEF